MGINDAQGPDKADSGLIRGRLRLPRQRDSVALMTYEAQSTLTDAARPRSEIWRTTVGMAILAVGTLALTAAWLVLVPRSSGGAAGGLPGASPAGMIWILSSFLCPLFVLALVMRLLHRRWLSSLIGPLPLAARHFGVALAVQTLILVVALLIPSPEGQEPVANLPAAVWIRWFLPAVLFLIIQVGVEELVFRGYLQSQLAARVRTPLIWLVVPAALFAVLHLDPTTGENSWPIVGVTLLFALAAGDLTARTGTLGAAMAMHLVNNFGALMLIGPSGPMQGLALYVVPVDMSDPTLLPTLGIEALLIVIGWLGIRIALRR